MDSGLIDSFTIYILLGIGVSMMFGYITTKVDDGSGKLIFTNWERFLIIIIWPIITILFIVGFIRNFNR